MNRKRIIRKFNEWYKKASPINSSPQEAEELMEKYESIPLTLNNISEPYVRVCEVLTRAGYKTHHPLELHPGYSPYVYFECSSQYHVRHLASLLHMESNETNCFWDIRVVSAEVFANPEEALVYELHPDKRRYNDTRVGPRARQKMIDDLDIIGMCVLRYFKSVDLKSIEKARKEFDSKVKEFNNSKLFDEIFRK